MSETGSRRRDAGKERQWRGIIRAQGASGQSVREYCRGAGVKESAFYWWRRELGRRSMVERAPRRGPEAQASPPRPARKRKTGPARSSRRTAARGEPLSFVPIHVLADTTAAGIEIHFDGGRKVFVRPGFDGQTLREVLAVLESRPC